MNEARDKLKKIPWPSILLITISIIFFSIRLIFAYDSAHYLGYVEILEGEAPISSWDIVRGPIFPTIIFVFGSLFGKTSTGILVGTFIFYLIFVTTCYLVCKGLCRNLKRPKLMQNILLAIVVLNPLIIGFFHTLLTEFVAITITMLNILISYRWIYFDINNKKRAIGYSFFFILSVTFCYHLKQPYIIIAFIPPLTAIIVSIVNNHTFKNIFYRLCTIILSVGLLFLSIATWNAILHHMGVNTNTGRDSASLLSKQLLTAYRIEYNENDEISTGDSIGIIISNFISNPPKLIQIYLENYCGLTSICVISSEDGVGYTSTSSFAGTNLFENRVIGYRAYSDYPNIFPMTEQLYNRAQAYGEDVSPGFIALLFNAAKVPTNLLFKFSTLTCIFFLIFLVFTKKHFKNTQYINIFYLTLILLTTASFHMIISAGLGLIIDRYAIEIFAPACLGISGSTIFYILSQKASKQHRSLPKSKKAKNPTP